MSDELKEMMAGYTGEFSGELTAAPPCPNGQLYTVRSGDTLFFIARRFNISLQSLINANPQIEDPNIIFPGQVICIPSAAPGLPCSNGQVYRVVRGDTMFEIARRFGVSLDALIGANPQISDPNLIYPGQEICIPGLPGPVPCSNGTLYTVKSGDTMFEIARLNNISLTALIEANPQIPDPNRIFPGQVICVPAPIEEIPEPMFPLPAPGQPMPLPVPLPMPVQPMPLPMPVQPMPAPLPCPRRMPEVSPVPCPRPVQPLPVKPTPVAPCPSTGLAPSMYPMPVYIVIPWDECPYRPKKRKKHERNQKTCH